MATGLVAGSYTVTVKDDNNCQAVAGPIIITEVTPVSGTIGVPTMVLCVTVMLRWKCNSIRFWRDGSRRLYLHME